jgi:hypothetical protein
MSILQSTTFSFVAAAGCVALAPVAAAEPVEQFLAALRGRGYHDMAVEYLERVLKSSAADGESKRRYSLELGSELLDAARAQTDAALRDQLVAEGLEKLKAFVAANPADPLVAKAHLRIAETLLDRGRAVTARANLSRDKDSLRAQARAMLHESAQFFAAVEKDRLAQFKALPQDADTEARNQLGGTILEARLRIAEAASDAAKTFDAGSNEAKAALRQGIGRYQQLYDKYHTDGFVAAYVARVREAENYLALGEADEALKRLEDVLGFDARSESLRDLVLTPAYLAALKAWHGKSAFRHAIDKAESYVASPNSAESNRPDWLEMQYLLALAFQKQAETLKPGDKERTKFETEARKLAGQVVKQKSDVQNDARLLLGKLGRPAETEAADAKSFDEALDRATSAIQELTAAKVAAEEQSSAGESDKASAERLAKQMTGALRAAYRAVEQALVLADDKTDAAKLNTARFYLCYLNWEYAQSEAAKGASSSRYFDAAALGDFLARRFPNHANARQAMAIALASYQKIRQDEAARVQQAAEKSDQNSDDVRKSADAALAAWSAKIVSLAEFAIEKWPDTDEAASAIAVLAAMAVERQEIGAALKLIDKLKPDSARRADTELRVGRAIWAQYVRAKKELDHSQTGGDTQGSASASSGAQTRGNTEIQGGTDKPGSSVAASPMVVDRKTLAEWATQAQSLLERGLTTVKKKAAEIDRTFVIAQLALVQSYVSTSQPEKAIAWLEDETTGLLKLVDDKHEAAEIEGLMFDVYRLALRAHIAVKPQQLDKALATMDALEKITGDDAKGREMLTAIYVAMGRDLQDEIKQLVAAGDATGVAALSGAFEAFLKRLVGRESGATFNSLYWVADTFVELAAGLAQAPPADSTAPAALKRSREYYEQAVAAFESILKRDKADGSFMPDQYLPLVEMKLAKAYRGAGEHNKALTLLTALLKEKPNVLDIQFDAAYTYQEFAASDPAKRGKYFRQAVLGGDTDEYRNVWGWNALAQKIRAQHERLRREADDPAKAQQAEDYRQRYQEARFNSVYCTYALSLQAASQAEKERLLKVAKQGIWSVYAIVDAELGGGQWKTKNDRLLREIQKALGEPETGLKEFEQRKRQQAQSTK